MSIIKIPYEKISNCRICYHKKLSLILNLSSQPPANSLQDSNLKKLLKIPLKLLICDNCKTVQLSVTVDPKYLFENYVWVTGTSKGARDYSKIFFKNSLKHFKNKKLFVVEIASNDGTFLKPFIKNNHKVLGIDPAKNIVDIANENKIPSIAKFFDNKISKHIIKKHGKADFIFCRNVIAHVKNIHSIIQGIHNLLDDNGIAALEPHYSNVILKDLQYDSIYHEHLFYFSVQTLSFICEQYGLKPFDVELSPISGGAFVLYVSKKKIRKSKKLQIIIKKEKKDKINEKLTWINFAKKCIKHRDSLHKKIAFYSKNEKITAYGASARSSTLLNFSKINNKLIDYIIDKNSIKHNKLSPGSNIEIISYSNGRKLISKKKIILLLAWNFAKEIIKDLKKDGYKGKFLIPLPKKTKRI